MRIGMKKLLKLVGLVSILSVGEVNAKMHLESLMGNKMGRKVGLQEHNKRTLYQQWKKVRKGFSDTLKSKHLTSVSEEDKTKVSQEIDSKLNDSNISAKKRKLLERAKKDLQSIQPGEVKAPPVDIQFFKTDKSRDASRSGITAIENKEALRRADFIASKALVAPEKYKGTQYQNLDSKKAVSDIRKLRSILNMSDDMNSKELQLSSGPDVGHLDAGTINKSLSNEALAKNISDESITNYLSKLSPKNSSNEIISKNITREPQSMETENGLKYLAKKKKPNLDDVEAQIDAVETKKAVDMIQKGMVSTQLANDPKAREAAEELAKSNSKLNPYVQKDVINTIRKEPESPLNATTSNMQSKEKGEEPSVKNSFLEALTFFLPQALGMGVGALIGGEAGAVEGGEQAGKMAEGFREYKLKQQQLAQKNVLDPMEKHRLWIQEQNLKLRQAELDQSKTRTGNLESLRGFQKESSIRNYVDGVEKNFTQDPMVKKLREKVSSLKNARDVVTQGKQLPEAQLALIARSLSDEKGTLNESDVKRAQINPDFISNIKREWEKFVAGKSTEKDVRDMNALLDLLEEKNMERLGAEIDRFSSSRSKESAAMVPDLADRLRTRFGVVKKKEEPSSDRAKALADRVRRIKGSR